MKKLFKKLMAMLLTITLFTGMFPAAMASGEGTDETVTCEALEHSQVHPAEEYSEQADAETNANTATEFEKELGTGAMDESGKETESDLEAENEEKPNSDFVTDSEGEITEDASSENEEETVTDFSTEGEEEIGSASTTESQENAESEPVTEGNGETAPDSASEPEEKTGVDTSMEAEEDAEPAEDPNAGISLMSVHGDSDDYRNVLRIYYIGDVSLEEDFTIKWVPIYGPHHYEITVTRNNLDGTTTNIVSAYNTGAEPSYTVSGSYVSQNAESFSIYVEAYAGESGEELMLDAMTTVGVEKDSNHVEYLVMPEERKVYLLLEKTDSWQVPVEAKWPSKPTVTDVTTGENVYVYNWTEFDTGYIFNFCFHIEPGHMYRICAVDRSGRTAIYESVFMKDECKHEQEGVYWEPNQLKIRSVGQSAHKISGEGYTYCLSCLEMLKTYSIEREESHILDANGNCTVCGYRTSCAHTHTEYVLSTEDPLRYVQTTERTYHRTFRWEYETCVDCKQRLSKRENYSEEPHTMNQNGVCTLCGFGSSGDVCFHPKYQIAWDPNYPTTYTWVSDTLHLIEGYRYYICADCAEPIGESFAATEYHGHTMDASGKCTLCENDSGCVHVNTETAWDKSYPITYTESDLNLHTASGYKYRYCTSCYERIGESFAVTVQESHTVGKTWDPVFYTPTYTPLNETEHLMEGVEFNYCTECFGRTSRSFFDNRTEIHTLDASGNCTLCGYPNGCTHPNTETAWDTSYRITYRSADDTGHIAKGYMYRYCTSCFAKIGGRVPVRVSEKHTLDAYGDCTICDFRAGCAHKETKKQLVDTSYSSADKDTHEVVKLYSKVCANPACNKVLVRVEPSYTEKSQEAHSFQADTCTLCGYTLADELTVCVTVSSETGNVGERISATAAVSGGDGGYSYGWKVLLDGAVKVETDMGFGSSYDYAAKQEGSYAFAVTVRDGSGNTATAQSSPITVKHIHDYKTVSSTELINQDTTFHNVVTTTYEECSICHHKTDPVAETVQKKHTAQSQGYEAAHPHKQYFVCKCGAHPYVEGKYKTANGKVQDAAVCCICHGHKWDDPVELSDGSFKQICNRCGETQIVYQEQDACDHEYAVEYSDHPHKYSREYCKKCGRLMDAYGTYIDSVTGEEWTRMFGNNGRLRSGCEKCFPKKMDNDHLIDMANLSIMAYETRSIVKQAEKKMGSKKEVTLENIKLGDKEAQKITVSKIGGGIYQINSHDQSGLRITADSGLPDSYIYVEETVDGELVLNIAFEGTIDVWDWITNFSANANNDGLHSGFGQVAKKYLYSVFNNTGDSEYKLRCTIDGVWKDWSLAEILSECANPEQNGHIRITGHSLGGAAAQCLAYYLMSDINGDEADSYFPWGWEINKEKIEVYTYASPIPFSFEALEDERFRNVNVYNIINVNDSVPDVGVTMSDFLVTRFAEAAGAAAAGIMSQENYNGGFSTAGTNMGTNIYLSSDNLANWEESGIGGNHNMSATYLKLVQEYVDGTIPAYTLNTDILRSDSYILNNHEETKAIANISNEIIKKLKISEKAAKKGTWAYNILNGMN